MKQLDIRQPPAHGHCGDCGSPILFLSNVLLCDECALARITRLEATR